MVNTSAPAHGRATAISLAKGVRHLILVPSHLSFDPTVLIATVASHVVGDRIDDLIDLTFDLFEARL